VANPNVALRKRLHGFSTGVERVLNAEQRARAEPLAGRFLPSGADISFFRLA
jgi:hypothetical protein